MNEIIEMISPESMIAAIRAFMDDTGGPDDLGSARIQGKGADEGTLGKKKMNSIQNYWSQLSQVVSDESVDVWRQLEKDAMNYKDILSKRAQSVAEVDSLVAQNAELKRVLNQYLGDGSNDLFC